MESDEENIMFFFI